MISRIIRKISSLWTSIFLIPVKKEKDSLNWGIMGTGYMAATFSKTINRSKSNILYGVASRSKDKAIAFSKRHRAKKGYESYENLIEDPQIDVVYVATPVQCHYENVKMCINAGKHVLCEKPLCLTKEEAEELFDLAKKNNVFLMEGMWSLLLPTMRTAKEWIAKGRIGKVEFIRADINKRVKNNHIQQHKGVLNDYGIYGVSFMLFFIGKNAHISSSVGRFPKNEYPTDWTINYGDGDTNGCINIMSNFDSLSKAVIIGETGSIEWLSPFNRTNTIKLYDNACNPIDTFKASYSDEGFEYELNEVNDCIKDGKLESDIISSNFTTNCIKTIQTLNDGIYHTHC